MNPYICSQMIFDKDARQFSGENTIFSRNGAGKTIIQMKKNELGPL